MVINPEQLEVLEVGGESGNGCAGDLVCEARSVVGTIHVTALLAQLCIRHDLASCQPTAISAASQIGCRFNSGAPQDLQHQRKVTAPDKRLCGFV